MDEVGFAEIMEVWLEDLLKDLPVVIRTGGKKYDMSIILDPGILDMTLNPPSLGTVYSISEDDAIWNVILFDLESDEEYLEERINVSQPGELDRIGKTIRTHVENYT